HHLLAGSAPHPPPGLARSRGSAELGNRQSDALGGGEQVGANSLEARPMLLGEDLPSGNGAGVHAEPLGIKLMPMVALHQVAAGNAAPAGPVENCVLGSRD